MLRLLALVLSLAIFSAQADSGVRGSLKSAFDELNYSLTVEWDQQDKDFFQQEMGKFQKTVSALRSQGLTNEELIEFMISNVKDEAAAADLKQFFELAQTQKLSPEEVEAMTREIMNRHYHKGAAWIGTVLIIGASLIVLIVGVTALILWDASNNPADCQYDYVCDPYGNNCSYTNYHCN